MPNGRASQVIPITQLTPLGVTPPVSVLNHRSDQCRSSPISRSRVMTRLKAAGTRTRLKVLLLDLAMQHTLGCRFFVSIAHRTHQTGRGAYDHVVNIPEASYRSMGGNGVPPPTVYQCRM